MEADHAKWVCVLHARGRVSGHFPDWKTLWAPFPKKWDDAQLWVIVLVAEGPGIITAGVEVTDDAREHAIQGEALAVGVGTQYRVLGAELRRIESQRGGFSANRVTARGSAPCEVDTRVMVMAKVND